jgi:Protein of unknown function (DUF998)
VEDGVTIRAKDDIVLPAACFVLAHRFAVEPRNRGWAMYSRITGALILLSSVLSTLIVTPLAENGVFSSPTGLIQRAQIIIGWTWLALTALRLLRQEQEQEQEADKGFDEQPATPQQVTPTSAS